MTPVNKPKIMNYFDAGIGNIETQDIDLSRLMEKILKSRKSHTLVTMMMIKQLAGDFRVAVFRSDFSKFPISYDHIITN